VLGGGVLMAGHRETTGQPVGRARRSWRWRATYFAGVVLTAAALVTGLASATLNAAGSGTGSAAAGSVAVSLNSAATRTCAYGSLLPGGLAGSATCALSVTFTGTLPAFLSLTVQVQAKAGRGGAPLYGGNGAGLTLSVSDGHTSFTVPAGPGVTGGSCPSGFTCWTAANDLAAWYGGDGTPNLTFPAGTAVTFTVAPGFARTAGNSYQGGTATVTLTAQAVQAPGNPLPSGCGISTIGQPCPATGTFTWS
jgi:hypothetical protein